MNEMLRVGCAQKELQRDLLGRILHDLIRHTPADGRSDPATGSALATVRKIAGRNGGRAWVGEIPGGGATSRVETAVLAPTERC